MFARGEASGPIAARADGVELALGEATIPGDLAVAGELRRYRLGSGRAELTATRTHRAGGAEQGAPRRSRSMMPSFASAGRPCSTPRRGYA